MNDDKHAPTDEFVEYLARDTMRRLRHEVRFAPKAGVNPIRARITTLAIAAGMVFTLSTGMVLGASANYASAEVLPNGTTTIPSRPALAILPIKSALTAIGCTQPVEHAVASTVPATASNTSSSTASASTASTALTSTSGASIASLSSAATAPVDQVATPMTNPDRALIALLTKQHQAAVVRGDTASDFIVMVLDASQNYVWSTHGNGGLSVGVGGDTRTDAERDEYNRVYAGELRGNVRSISSGFSFSVDTTRGTWVTMRRDSQNVASTRVYYNVQVQTAVDSVRQGALRARLRDSVRPFSTNFPSNAGCGTAAVTRFARTGAVSDSVLTVYTTGYQERRQGARCNQASGLQERNASESGIIGLAAANVSKADFYLFGAGELAPRDLKVLVVHLTAGTVWSGR